MIPSVADEKAVDALQYGAISHAGEDLHDAVLARDGGFEALVQHFRDTLLRASGLGEGIVGALERILALLVEGEEVVHGADEVLQLGFDGGNDGQESLLREFAFGEADYGLNGSLGAHSPKIVGVSGLCVSFEQGPLQTGGLHEFQGAAKQCRLSVGAVMLEEVREELEEFLPCWVTDTLACG